MLYLVPDTLASDNDPNNTACADGHGPAQALCHTPGIDLRRLPLLLLLPWSEQKPFPVGEGHAVA